MFQAMSAVCQKNAASARLNPPRRFKHAFSEPVPSPRCRVDCSGGRFAIVRNRERNMVFVSSGERSMSKNRCSGASPAPAPLQSRFFRTGFVAPPPGRLPVLAFLFDEWIRWGFAPNPTRGATPRPRKGFYPLTLLRFALVLRFFPYILSPAESFLTRFHCASFFVNVRSITLPPSHSVVPILPGAICGWRSTRAAHASFGISLIAAR